MVTSNNEMASLSGTSWRDGGWRLERAADIIQARSFIAKLTAVQNNDTVNYIGSPKEVDSHYKRRPQYAF